MLTSGPFSENAIAVSYRSFIDLHCHILPGLDDGPENFDEALKMAEAAEKDGIRTLVATPHTHNGVYTNPPTLVRKEAEAFSRRIAGRGLALSVLPGAEVHLCPGMAAKVKAKEVGTVNDGGRYLLVEFPFRALPEGFSGELFRLNLEGIVPILVHPERIFELQKRFDLFYELVAMGCLTQVTAMSITGELGGAAQKCALRLLRCRLVHLIASDAHSADARPPVLSPAVAEAARILDSRKEAAAMVSERPLAILEGRPVSVPEPIHPEKRKMRFFRRKG